MAVSTLVMEPGGAIALLPPLLVIGAVVTLKIFDSRPEFRRRVFGQIVRQSLPIEPQPEAVFPHEGAVPVYGF
jgi:hypothetical protein